MAAVKEQNQSNKVYDPIENWDEDRNLLSPDLLPNTAFIYNPPNNLSQYFLKKFDEYIGYYNLTIKDFEKEFLSGIGSYYKWRKETYNPRLRTAQSVLTLMYQYDIDQSYNKNDRLFKSKCPILKDRLCDKIKSFSRRHSVAEVHISNCFLGDPKILHLFRTNKISLSLASIDSLFYNLHLEDLALIKDMGIEFDKWVERNKTPDIKVPVKSGTLNRRKTKKQREQNEQSDSNYSGGDTTK